MLWLLPDGRFRMEMAQVHRATPSAIQWFFREVYEDALVQPTLGPFWPPHHSASLTGFRSQNWDALGTVYPVEALALLDPLETMRSYAAEMASLRKGVLLGFPVHIYRMHVTPDVPEHLLELPLRYAADVEIAVTEDGRFVLGWDDYLEGELMRRSRIVQLDLDARFDEDAFFTRSRRSPTWF